MAEVTRRLIARVGVDIAKQVVHVHAVDGAGRPWHGGADRSKSDGDRPTETTETGFPRGPNLPTPASRLPCRRMHI